MMLFSSSGTANHLSNDQFSVLEKYSAPMDFGFRISIMANEPNKTGRLGNQGFTQGLGWLERQKPGQTLQATALVYESYIRLVANAKIK